jgi:7-cyano-7-deazaguanine synthase in queuosine biosynthesis
MNYKVVKIVNEYLLVVNYGQKQNAEVGDILEVYQVGEQVLDPDTFDDLGTLDITKGRIKVKNVYEKMSLCESNGTHRIESSTGQSFVNTISMLTNALSRIEQKALEVNTEQVSGGYNEGDKGLINLSDPVRIIKSKYLDQIENEENDSEE